jgi:hypothetical protein
LISLPHILSYSIRPELHYLYSHGGKVMVVPEFMDEADMGGAQTNEKVFSESEVDIYHV